MADSNRLYEGWTAQGHVQATILNGQVIYRDGKFLGKPGDGRIVRPNHSGMQ